MAFGVQAGDDDESSKSGSGGVSTAGAIAASNLSAWWWSSVIGGVLQNENRMVKIKTSTAHFALLFRMGVFGMATGGAQKIKALIAHHLSINVYTLTKTFRK